MTVQDLHLAASTTIHYLHFTASKLSTIGILMLVQLSIFTLILMELSRSAPCCWCNFPESSFVASATLNYLHPAAWASVQDLHIAASVSVQVLHLNAMSTVLDLLQITDA
jgi:hypothetical protein